MALRRYSRTVTANLSAEQSVELEAEEITGEGEAASSVTAPLRGECSIHVVALKYSGSPETTTVEITDTFSGAQVLKVSGNTDTVFYPVVTASTTAGKASTLTELAPIAGRLTHRGYGIGPRRGGSGWDRR